MPERSPADRLKSYVFIAVGLLLLGATLYEAYAQYGFVQTAARAPGRVTQLNAGGSHPQIAFTTAAGQSCSYPQGGMIAGYEPGDVVTVLYDPRHPREAVLDSFGALWGFISIQAFMGLVFIGGGWALLNPNVTWLEWRAGRY